MKPVQLFRFLAHLFTHLFHRLCENFRPRPLKVRSPGHVKWPHFRKVCMLVIATPTDWSHRNFQRLIPVVVSIKRISRNFYIGNLRSEQFCDLSIISQWEKNERHFFNKTIRNTLKHQITGRLDTLSRNIATSGPSSFRQGHGRSSAVVRQ